MSEEMFVGADLASGPDQSVASIVTVDPASDSTTVSAEFVVSTGPDDQSELARLRKENQELHAVLYGDPRLICAKLDSEGIAIDMSHWAIRHIVASLKDSLGDAPNWKQMQLYFNESGEPPILVTIHRPGGEMPEDQVIELKKKVRELEKVVMEGIKQEGEGG